MRAAAARTNLISFLAASVCLPFIDSDYANVIFVLMSMSDVFCCNVT